MNPEELAKALQEASAYAGNLILEGMNRKFYEDVRLPTWDEIPEPAREGRRKMAKYLLERFEIRRYGDG